MEEKIRKVLEEKVDPLLASHFGGAVLTAFEDGVAYVKLTGSCSTCPSAQYTIEDIVKRRRPGGASRSEGRRARYVGQRRPYGHGQEAAEKGQIDRYLA
jgi:hypothetical protein